MDMRGALFDEGGSGKVIDPSADNNQKSILEVAAHPVTQVYVDENAIVCYERFEADPIKLNAVSPLRSRQAAKKRADAACEHAPEINGRHLWDVRIAETLDVGLTYRELVAQTRMAIEQSFELEKQLTDEAVKKAKRYGII
jgi:hypothetical protein